MARKVVVSLIDDLDGGQANETVEFALDGENYEIDLSSRNAGKLRAIVTTYVAVARQSTRPRRGARPSSSAGSTPRTRVRSDRQDNQSVREWARGQGLTPCDRGRIPTAMLEFYHQQAHSVPHQRTSTLTQAPHRETAPVH
jgi:hypothetical protein